MELITICLFCLIMISCIATGHSILIALIFGVFLFSFYCLKEGFQLKQIFSLLLSGVLTVKNILIVFLLIGMLTATWKACGTIPYIICRSVHLISPGSFLVMTFILNSLISVLTGTSFGTAATMGAICMTMGISFQINPMLTGGAVLSGIFFGDRCSPVSTSALLVCELTHTNIFTNIRYMIRTAIVPTILCIALYAILGIKAGNEVPNLQLDELFSQQFHLTPILMLPAILMLVLCLLRVNVRIVMAVSTLSAIIICFFIQGLSLSTILTYCIFGFKADIPDIAVILNGGGILSMMKVLSIVLISASYSSIFKETNLLKRIGTLLEELSFRITPFGAILLTSVITSMMTCSQTLAVILTNQLGENIESDSQKRAIMLENTAILTAALIPWSIAGTVPLQTIGAPITSLLFGFFLILIPLWQLIIGRVHIPR